MQPVYIHRSERCGKWPSPCRMVRGCLSVASWCRREQPSSKGCWTEMPCEPVAALCMFVLAAWVSLLLDCVVHDGTATHLCHRVGTGWWKHMRCSHMCSVYFVVVIHLHVPACRTCHDSRGQGALCCMLAEEAGNQSLVGSMWQKLLEACAKPSHT